jgi:hypothetical protein
MKRVDLERWLRQHGCAPLGGKGRGGHDTWTHLESGALATLPRHREIGPGLGRAICRQLGVPPIRRR